MTPELLFFALRHEARPLCGAYKQACDKSAWRHRDMAPPALKWHDGGPPPLFLTTVKTQDTNRDQRPPREQPPVAVLQMPPRRQTRRQELPLSGSPQQPFPRWPGLGPNTRSASSLAQPRGTEGPFLGQGGRGSGLFRGASKRLWLPSSACSKGWPLGA